MAEFQFYNSESGLFSFHRRPPERPSILRSAHLQVLSRMHSTRKTIENDIQLACQHHQGLSKHSTKQRHRRRVSLCVSVCVCLCVRLCVCLATSPIYAGSAIGGRKSRAFIVKPLVWEQRPPEDPQTAAKYMVYILNKQEWQCSCA